MLTFKFSSLTFLTLSFLNVRSLKSFRAFSQPPKISQVGTIAVGVGLAVQEMRE
jgi:hypothetical protein